MANKRDGPELVRAVRGALQAVVRRKQTRPVGDRRRAVGGACTTEEATILGLERGDESTVPVVLSPVP